MRQSPAMASALAHRSFRIFWIGTVLTYTSQWVQQVTLSWAAYQITGSLTIAGLILGGRAVPMFLLAPFSGVAAERYDRRSIILVGQVALAIGTAVIGGLFGRKTANQNRTEVVVLLTPTIVRDQQELRDFTDEYSRQFRALEPIEQSKGPPRPQPNSGRVISSA